MSHCFTSEIFEKFSFKLSSFMNCIYYEKFVTGLRLANQTRLFGVFFTCFVTQFSKGLYFFWTVPEAGGVWKSRWVSRGAWIPGHLCAQAGGVVWTPPASTGDFYTWQSHFVWGFSSIMKTSLSPLFKVAFHVGELFKRCWVTEIEAFDGRFS